MYLRYARAHDLFRAGKVYVFNVDGEHLQTLLPPESEMNAKFGSAVDIQGDIIVVGEEGGDVNLFKNEGKTYVFNVNGTLLQTLIAPDPSVGGAFGSAVDIRDDIIVVGEYFADVDGEPDSGRFHVYKLGAMTPVEVQESVEESTKETEESETDTTGGIPGFPVLTILAAIVIFYISRKWFVRIKSSIHLHSSIP